MALLRRRSSGEGAAIDISVEAAAIVAALSAEGLEAEARSLRDTVAGGATGTEILMGLRFHLKTIQSAGEVADPDTRRAVRRLLAELNRALRA